MRRLKTLVQCGCLAFVLAAAPNFATAQDKPSFRIAWAIYVGFMPWGYMEDKGILQKWGDKYGIDIEAVQIPDYIESINQYTAGAFDGVAATNMDTLSIPSAGGIDTTALIIGDYSNGNDAVILKGPGTLKDLAGKPVNLVELSVSHFLLARALDSVGMREAELGAVINTSDADMIAAFATEEVEAVVAWNPAVQEIVDGHAEANVLFDSSMIPGEILDMLVVNTNTLEEHPEFGKALTGAWYEVLSLMASGDEDVLTDLGIASGTDLAGYKQQLAATEMFYDPAQAVAQAEDPKLPETMQSIAEFLFEKGILGVGANNPDFVGISYPSGVVTGDPDNVMFRFNSTYMRMAADGRL